MSTNSSLDYDNNIDTTNRLILESLMPSDLSMNVWMRKIHQLFDTLHDFGKLSTCYDTLVQVIRNEPNYNLKKMAFYTLAKYCYSIDNTDLYKKYSNLTTPIGKASSNLISKNLENFFLRYAISLTGNAEYGYTKRYNTDLHNEIGYARLLDIYSDSFIDSNTGCLNIIVDTQKNVYKCIKNRSNEEPNKIAVIITRESIYDPATKLDSKQPVSYAFLEGKFYQEIDGVNYREYTCDGNVPINIGGIVSTGPRNLINFNVNNKNIIKCTLNSSSKHQNSITYINKAITNAIKATNVGSKKTFKNLNTGNLVEQVYSDNLNVEDVKDVYIENFTGKRIGDACQAEIAMNVNNGLTPMTCKNYGGNNETVDITKLVVVTIDRMLFARCIFLKVPAIFDNGINMTCYNPLKNIDTIQGGSKASKTSNGIKASREIYNFKGSRYKTRSQVLNTSDDEIADSIFTEPYILYTFIPFLIGNSNLQSNKKIAKNVYHNTIQYCIDNNTHISTCIIEDKPYIVYDNQFDHSKALDESVLNDIYLHQGDYANYDIKCYSQTAENKIIRIKHYTNIIDITFNKGTITNIIDRGYSNSDIPHQILESFINGNGLLEQDGQNGGGDNDKLLNYYNIAMSADINAIEYKLKDKLKQLNYLTIFGYLWLFQMYEAKICVDFEQIEMDYDDCNISNPVQKYYVPTHKKLYLLFKTILEMLKKDFILDNIWFGYLEDILHDIDYELYYRIQQLKMYTVKDDEFSTYLYHDTDGKMDKTIYENTKEIMIIISEGIKKENQYIESKMVELYAEDESMQTRTLYEYCKTLDLNRYSFLYMFQDINNIIYNKPLNKNISNASQQSVFSFNNSNNAIAVRGGKRNKTRKYKNRKNKISKKRFSKNKR